MEPAISERKRMDLFQHLFQDYVFQDHGKRSGSRAVCGSGVGRD
jgi:hypothetical protein